MTRPLNPEHINFETQFASLAPQLNSKWLKGFLHVLKKYIYDLFHVFRRKWLNLLYTDFKTINLDQPNQDAVSISFVLPRILLWKKSCISALKSGKRPEKLFIVCFLHACHHSINIRIDILGQGCDVKALYVMFRPSGHWQHRVRAVSDTHTLVELASLASGDKALAIWIPGDASQAVLMRLTHLCSQLPCLCNKAMEREMWQKIKHYTLLHTLKFKFFVCLHSQGPDNSKHYYMYKDW